MFRVYVVYDKQHWVLVLPTLMYLGSVCTLLSRLPFSCR
jgi:hypothetical protein